MIIGKLSSMKSIPVAFLFVAGLVATGCSSSKNVAVPTSDETREAILSDNWVFVAQTALPQGGRSRVLDSRYDVRLGRDTLNSFLPYFGRSFSGAGVMGNSNPLDFRSTRFTVDRQELKKGGWRVTIRPNDVQAVQSMTADLFDNGSASLNVTLTDRTPMTFQGKVEPRRR
jgi:hypothetical protein